MGAADPAAEFGNEGDIWFNTTTWDVFTKNADGWTKVGNVKGKEGDTPEITIGTDGYWYVDGESTGVKAKGEDGNTPDAPTVTIGDDGFWYVNGVSTDVQATGDEGHTPEVGINDDGYWEVDGVSTGVKATGNTGNGIAKIEKVSYDEETRVTTYKVTYTNGNSFTYYVKDGKDGDKGDTGATGKSAYELYCAQFGYTGTEAEWLQALADGTLVNRAKYTVTFDTDGGSEIASQQVTKWEKVSKPEDPTKEGYAFAGWMCGDEMWSFNGGIVTSDMTLTARWTKNYYTASFKFDGVVVETRNIVKGSVIDMPYHSTYYGFYSHNWVANETTYNVLDNVTIASDADITFTATVKHLSENYNCTVTTDFDGVEWAAIGDYNGPIDVFELPRFAYIDNNFIEVRELEYYTFNGSCSGHNYIKEIPNTYTTLGMSAFYCTFENPLFIPSSVTNVAEDAFRYAEKNTIAIEAESIPTTWSSHWQANCPSVITGVTSIEEGTIDKFDYRSYLTKKGGDTEITKYNGSDKEVTIPRSIGRTAVTQIGSHAFYQNRMVESLTVPSTVKRILPYAFNSMSSLSHLELNKGLEYIGESVFGYTNSLEEIDLPSTVKTLASYAFIQCDAIVYSTLETAPSGWSNTYGIPTHLVLGYDGYREKSEDGYVTMAQVIRGGETTGIVVGLEKKEGGERVSDYVMPSSMSNGVDIEYMVSQLTASYYFDGTLTLPSKLKEIPSFGCAYVPYISEFILPSTLTKIGSNAFNQSQRITKIAIPSSVTSIEDHAFYWCTSLTDVSFGDTNMVVDVSEKAFAHCSSLETITFPISVSFVGNYVFDECDKLTNINLRGFRMSSWSDKWNCKSEDDSLISATITETYSD